MKQLKDLTLEEFNKYTVLVNEKKPKIVEIFKLFGIDFNKLKAIEITQLTNEIVGMSLPTKGTNLVYKINGKRFTPTLNLLKLSAAQFIDLQTYTVENKQHELASVFLIPQYRSRFGFWKTFEYGEGYDISQVQEFLYKYMTIGDYNNLSNFFLTFCQKQWKVTEDYLEKREMKRRLKIAKQMLDDIK